MRILATPIVRVRPLVIPLSSNTIFLSMGTSSWSESFFIKLMSDPVSIMKFARLSRRFLLGRITEGGFPILLQVFILAFPLGMLPDSPGALAGVRSALRLLAGPGLGFPNSLGLYRVAHFQELYSLY
jgi:hypothetical protein